MKRNKFSLSNYKLFSCDMGELIPCGVLEVLPGDTIQMSTSALVRASALLSPVMHPVHCRIHHWYVPFRLIWEDFEEFITGGPDGMDASSVPSRDLNGVVSVGVLGDYLGYPPISTSLTCSMLPYRAYATIWNDWYRDQDLQTALTVSKASGNDNSTSTALQNVCWEKDYFTSARPWEQKGPSITLPLGTTAPVTGIGVEVAAAASATDRTVWETDKAANQVYSDSWDFASPKIFAKAESAAVPGASNTPQIYANLAGASAVTVNVLREALALQRFEEARARYGSRYTEYLRYLGVRSSDARLQRPEYLGGGKQTIQFSEVLQTGVTTSGNTAGVGTLRGHGIGSLRSNRFRRFIEEHGYIMSLMSVKPRTMYADGVPRMYSRTTKEDYWQKELEHIGQQEVLNKEVRASHATPQGVFGYQDRYDEYRRQESSIAGEFRTTLNFWHFARLFSSDPALNAAFVSSVPTDRTFATPSEDVLYIMANHQVQARRLVSQIGTSMTF